MSFCPHVSPLLPQNVWLWNFILGTSWKYFETTKFDEIGRKYRYFAWSPICFIVFSNKFSIQVVLCILRWQWHVAAARTVHGCVPIRTVVARALPFLFQHTAWSWVCSDIHFLIIVFWIWMWQNQIMNRLYVGKDVKGCCQNSVFEV
jgi:hypothetical protein